MKSRHVKYTKSWVQSEKNSALSLRSKGVLQKLKKSYPGSKIMLNYTTPMQLLVAVMLSAQCTDKQVNKITSTLFKKYKTAKDFSRAQQATLEKEIYGTGFFRNKAKNVIASAKIIVQQHDGEVPQTMEELLQLPGVARKTANIVLIIAFKKSVGIPVDTHVSRIAQRLAFTKNNTPEKIEQDLMTLFPKQTWARLSYYFIEHGRAACISQKPKCETCPIRDLCPSERVTLPQKKLKAQLKQPAAATVARK